MRALEWNVADHQAPRGKSFSSRFAALAQDVEAASRDGYWQYFRRHSDRIDIETTVVDEAQRPWGGLNLGSQDYLGLSQHGAVQESAINAIRTMGAHSSGSGPMGGGSRLGDEVASKVAMQLGKRHALLFPTGWAAGYGIIRGLVRPYDYVVIDALAHNCLQHGASASTPNVKLFGHNSLESLESRLARIRKSDSDAAILVVTESRFSMDSDSPDLDRIIEIKDRYEAHLLIDVAHDFGILGQTGRGVLEEGAGYSGVEYVIGSFSKTFASIGGFFATDDLPSVRAVQGFSGSYTFSNYLIPAQLGAITAALDVAFSEAGDELRGRVLSNTRFLRARLEAFGVATSGRLSSMTIINVGAEPVARSAYRALLSDGIILNSIEFPAVRRGEARFRVQLTPAHTEAQLEMAARKISDAITQAKTG